MQGSPLAPLLSNLVLNLLDRELERRGLRFIRYADDIRIFCGSFLAGYRIKHNLGKYLEGRLGLQLHPKKSDVFHYSELVTLGFVFDDSLVASPSTERLEKAKANMLRLIARGEQSEILRFRKGWEGYFGPMMVNLFQALEKIH